MSWGRKPPAPEPLPQTEAEFRALYETDSSIEDDHGLLDDEDASELHNFAGPPPKPTRQRMKKRWRG